MLRACAISVQTVSAELRADVRIVSELPHLRCIAGCCCIAADESRLGPSTSAERRVPGASASHAHNDRHPNAPDQNTQPDKMVN